jgi:Fe2+ transport system protein FeoA
MLECVSLDSLALGETATIRRVERRDAAMLHLLELGLFPGEDVTVIRTAPAGDPLELDVMGYRLAIRRAEAAAIFVSRRGVRDAG